MTTVPIHADFYSDLRQFFIDQLTAGGYSIPSGVKHDEAGITFFNVLKRRIEPKSRLVYRSDELLGETLAPRHITALSKIEADSIAGNDLNPRLSKKLLNANYSDPLLNDWDLHHLHLGLVLQGDGFIERDGPLLFAKVTSTAMYFVAIRDHGRWSDSELMEIVHRNWPQTFAPFRLKGIKLTGPPLTEKEREDGRKAGLLMFTQMADGTLYAPFGGGIATDRTSVSAVTQSDSMYIMVNQWEQACRENSSTILGLVNASSGKSLLELKLKLIITNPMYVKEMQTDIIIRSDDLVNFYALAAGRQ